MDGWLDNLTGWGACGSLVVFIAVALIRGWLVPKTTHEREIRASDKRGDEWKETAMEGRATIAKLIDSNEIVKEYRAARDSETS